jgi:hypothetical protein
MATGNNSLAEKEAGTEFFLLAVQKFALPTMHQ